MSRELINEKFEGVSHKWLMSDINDSEIFKTIKNVIFDAKDQYKFNDKEDISNLVKTFKNHGFFFFKFLKCSGRSKITCHCQLISSKGIKIPFEIGCDELLKLPLLDGTPKSLGLYKNSKKVNSTWKKPNDGFSDSFEIPLDYEFTEDGYHLYKGYMEEIASKGMTLEQWQNRKVMNWCSLPSHFYKYIT